MVKEHIGIFGGTFDPIHLGHINTAIYLKKNLPLDEMRFIPCAIPPHREKPIVSFENRLNMVKKAISEQPGLVCDDRESKRESPSYSVETLKTLHHDFPKARFYLIIGMDSFINLNQWYEWESLFEFCHIIVITRPGYFLPNTEPMKTVLEDRLFTFDNTLPDEPSGKVLLVDIPDHDICATDIRAKIKSNLSVEALLPKTVLKYIHKEKLYQ